MTDVYQLVTDRIPDQLSKGTVPWHCPWACSGAGAISYSTGKPYSLLNQLLLGRPGEYITFNQAKALGGSVRKGEKSRFVVFWKLLEGKDKDTDEIRIIPILRYYNVFHINQCENIQPRWRISETENTDPGSTLHPDDKAEHVILDYIDRSGVIFKPCRSDKAYYSPSTDTIVIPELSIAYNIFRTIEKGSPRV
ncbi:MAG: ArdC family protein [Clostridia bacterium]|nr:ArdC family protein [Clostridia bacterium]